MNIQLVTKVTIPSVTLEQIGNIQTSFVKEMQDLLKKFPGSLMEVPAVKQARKAKVAA